MHFESQPQKKPSVPEVTPVHIRKTVESGPEKISCAVVELNGEHFAAPNHFTALLEMRRQHPNWIQEGLHPKEGFLTTTGRFVSREEAFEIADQAGQLDSDDTDGTRSLESEALH